MSHVRTYWVFGVVLMASCSVVKAGDYSVDPASPEVGPPLLYSPADIMAWDGAAIAIYHPSADLGLIAADDVDGFSYGLDALYPAGTGSWVGLLFSVTRGTVGVGPVGAVFVQSTTDGAAGDKFMARVSSAGGVIGPFLFSNAPLHGLTPLPTTPQSDLDAISMPSMPFGVRAYFSLVPLSPGLAGPDGIPGTADDFSPADILFQGAMPFPPPPPPPPPAPLIVYATAAALGLVAADDIDALAVRDLGVPDTLDGGDMVFISLTPGSPSLGTLTPTPAMETAGAVIQVFPLPAVVYATPAALGLLPTDDLNALTGFDPGCDLFGGGGGGGGGPGGEFSDDFTTVSTYDSASLLAPCYGGPPTKYTMIEMLNGDIFSEWAVSGGGKFKISSSAITTGALGVEGRLVSSIIGWLGGGIGCPGEPPVMESTVKFTNENVCIYGGDRYDYFQLAHAKAGFGEDRGEEYGSDNLPGKAGIDDDGDGTVDNGPLPGVDDDGDGTTDEPDESFGIQSSEYLHPGPDGQPGVAGVDDDGFNGIDDQGELGWSGSDDSDDTIGQWGLTIAIKMNLPASRFLSLVFDPQSAQNQFTMRETDLAVQFPLLPGPLNDEIGPAFFDPFTNYNYVFCASGTCFGAQLWTGNDMSNPNETVGPVLNMRHQNALGEVSIGAFTLNNGAYAKMANVTHQGNSNFSGTFWVVTGDPAFVDFANDRFGYPSPSADLDNDRDVDVNDFLTFSNCFNGSLVPATPGCQNAHADLDGDGDVDVNDFLTFSNCFNGSLKRPRNACFPL